MAIISLRKKQKPKAARMEMFLTRQIRKIWKTRVEKRWLFIIRHREIQKKLQSISQQQLAGIYLKWNRKKPIRMKILIGRMRIAVYAGSMETYPGSPREITLSDEIAEAVMRNVIRNIRLLLKDINDKEARTELMWASAMAENGGFSGRKLYFLFQGAAPEKWMMEAGEYTMKRFAQLYGMEYAGMAANRSEAELFAGALMCSSQ